jgi:hypothetical protein
MSMRTYAGLLLFEDIFDFVPTGEPEITNLANGIFSPNVLIVDADCHTSLGTFETVNFELEGLVETSTGLIISEDRIVQLLSQGIYGVYTRNVNSCISKGGVCAKCYNATHQDQPYPDVLDRVTIPPQYTASVDNLSGVFPDIPFPLTTDPSTYTSVLVYIDGIPLIPGVDFDIANNAITLHSPVTGGYWNGIVTYLRDVPYNYDFVPGQSYSITIRYMVNDTSPFLVWLSNTYSGSVLGIKPLMSEPLPLSSLFLTSLLTENRLQLVNNFIKTIPSIPTEYTDYIDQIPDALEAGLYMLVLYCIYSNVTT